MIVRIIVFSYSSIHSHSIPEIGQLDDPIVSYKAVGSLDVSMSDSIAMQILKTDQQLTRIGLGDGLL